MHQHRARTPAIGAGPSFETRHDRASLLYAWRQQVIASDCTRSGGYIVRHIKDNRSSTFRAQHSSTKETKALVVGSADKDKRPGRRLGTSPPAPRIHVHMVPQRAVTTIRRLSGTRETRSRCSPAPARRQCGVVSNMGSTVCQVGTRIAEPRGEPMGKPSGALDALVAYPGAAPFDLDNRM